VEAEKIAQVALPIVEGITTIVGVGPGIVQVETDINLLIALFEKYQATPDAGTLQQIQAGLNTANADIALIMPAAGIKSSATQDKVAAIVELVASEFSNIASLIPASSAPTPANSEPKAVGSRQKAASSKSALPSLSAKDFKKKYNEIVKGDPRFKKL
jgi:hypothetical protein